MNASPRSLKKIVTEEGSVFTLKTASGKVFPSLCDHCAASESTNGFGICELINRRPYGHDVLVEITHCSIHQPVIAFQPPLVGFESTFNTFRPGVAWFSRLNPGVVIGLFDSKKNTLFGKARVTGIYKGSIGDMLTNHATANHLMLNCESDQSEKLMTAMVKIYGPHIINQKSNVSVISLKRI